MVKSRLSLQPTASINALSLEVCTADNEVQAVYVNLSDQKAQVSKEYGPDGDLVLDFDAAGNLVGLEILEPKNVNIAILQKLSRKYHVPSLGRLRPKNLQMAFAN